MIRQPSSMFAVAARLAHADQPQDSHCLLKPADKKADVVGVSLSGSEGGPGCRSSCCG